MEAIHLINVHLKASSGVSDATIGAVAFLAIIEFILGNYEASNIHKIGLIQIVKLRGGLRDLNFSLQGKVCMANLFDCLEFDLPPRLPFFDTAVSHPTTKSTSQQAKLNQGFQDAFQIFAFESDFYHIFLGLQKLTDLFIRLSQAHKFTDRRELDHVARSIRHRLLSHPSARNTTTPQDMIRESLRLRALIYIQTFVLGYPSCDRIYKTLVDKLNSCNDGINLSGFSSHGGIDELVLWMLFAGGITDLGSDPIAWFAVRIPRVDEALRLRKWDEVKAVLKDSSFLKSCIIGRSRHFGMNL